MSIAVAIVVVAAKVAGITMNIIEVDVRLVVIPKGFIGIFEGGGVRETGTAVVVVGFKIE